MSGIPSPPQGYSCEIRGFDNVPDRSNAQMPTPGAIATPLVDRIMDDSNTDRTPFGAAIPGAITAQEAWAAKGSTSGRPR